MSHLSLSSILKLLTLFHSLSYTSNGKRIIHTSKTIIFEWKIVAKLLLFLLWNNYKVYFLKTDADFVPSVVNKAI